VPEDVSLVGFDDMEAAPYIAPPLTTVRQDFNALGIQAIDYLVALIEQPNTPLHQRVLYPELVVRQSTRRLDNAGH
jgi:DNA-binding LacI/PurR family transcriptional regulator